MKHTHYSDLNRDGYVRFKLDDDIIKGIENSSIIEILKEIVLTPDEITNECEAVFNSIDENGETILSTSRFMKYYDQKSMLFSQLDCMGSKVKIKKLINNIIDSIYEKHVAEHLRKENAAFTLLHSMAEIDGSPQETHTDYNSEGINTYIFKLISR